MSTPTMNEIITHMSNYVRDSGYCVDWNEDEPFVVIYEEEADEPAFSLQYTEAEEFIKEAQRFQKEANVNELVAILAQAKQYIDCL